MRVAMHQAADSNAPRYRGWHVVYWGLTAIFLGTAALAIFHIHAGIVTSYAADLFVPPWMYVSLRAPFFRRPRVPILRWVSDSPGRLASSLFVASSVSELSQLYWPNGLFAGVFDPIDIAAYGIGLLACYVIETRSSSGRDLSQRDSV